MDFIGSMLLLLLALAVYFLPVIVADQRKHPQINAIGVINLVAGWTFLGWLIAMVWSVSAFRTPAAETAAAPAPAPKTTTAEKTCPRCAETVKAEAKVCRFCQHDFETETKAIG